APAEAKKNFGPVELARLDLSHHDSRIQRKALGGMSDAATKGMQNFERATLRNIVIAVPVGTACLIGIAYFALEGTRPNANANANPVVAPIATTTITSAEPAGAPDLPQTSRPAPRGNAATSATVPVEKERSKAPSTAPPSDSAPRDVTKMSPGSLN